MIEPFDIAQELLKNQLSSSNHYTLQIDRVTTPIFIHTVTGQEALNKPWRYEIIFTSSNKQIAADAILTQKASFTFEPPAPILSRTISSLTPPALPRTLHGVITEFSQLSVNKQQAHYKIVLAPRLALLGLHYYSAIYQNQSVIEVVEQILRKHGFIGIDYRLELHNSYPMREFITQWQESDLDFIQRILADIGVWFRFETDSKHGCEVLVISDSEQGFASGGTIVYKQPSGTADNGTDSIWDVQQHSKTVPQSVRVQDYNYRESNRDMLAEVNSQPDDNTTHGTQYLYDQHYKQKGDKETTETGAWYAQIRHQQHISQQLIITGKSNQYNLAPGQRIILSQHPLQANLSEGLIILSTQGQGNRTDSYVIEFTAIPFNLLKPYRPEVLSMPKISGTLPATITSPDNDTYGYLDTKGRYRVKFNFDLSTWKNGEESLWLRLAKPYSGDSYGFHFPLIDGTEVAIAFTDGNPNRPYIAHAMHDSRHPDHVSTANKHRNVIRTPANNKLRMDDKRGQQHIKLATEYGKTQLNIGHLVDNKKTKRGEGFELRTDEWGAIAANKGLYLTTQTEPKAHGKQLDMQSAITQLENALAIAKSLQNAVNNAQAEPADIASQQQLQDTLKLLNKSGMVGYAQEGIGLVSPQNIQLSTQSNLSFTADNNTDISVLKKITLAAGEALSLFANKMGIKLFASKGKVQIQAQNDAMELAAKQSININSIDASLLLTANKDITLICGGSYIKMEPNGIELGTSGNVTVKSASFSVKGPNQYYFIPPPLPEPYEEKSGHLKLFYHDSDLNPIPRASYRVEFEDGTMREGVLDDNGEAQLEDTPPGQADVYFGYSTDEPILPKLEDYQVDDYSAASVTKQLNEYITLSPDELNAYIDEQLDYTEEYIEIGKQKQGKE